MVDTPRPRPTDARRRRRVRVLDSGPDGSHDADSGSSGQTSAVHDEPTTWLVSEVDTAVERGLRGIVGGGSSQVTPGAALRARDAARPHPADLERSETELAIVRRHWTPRD
jgi:hypothetical protein